MTGSVADGEDVVQDTLARAYYQLSELKELPPLRPWLFRIAHNRAIDHLRREGYRAHEPLDTAMEVADHGGREPDNALARSQAVRAAISSFLQLAPAQRGCVILKDVLEYPIEEIAGELDLSVPAVKAALHRGRERLRELADAPAPAPRALALSPALVRYASLFNAHDWDGVRAMLADDVRLDGREVLAVHAGENAARPDYFIELVLHDEQVAAIRDFRYVPYIAQEAAFAAA